MSYIYKDAPPLPQCPLRPMRVPMGLGPHCPIAPSAPRGCPPPGAHYAPWECPWGSGPNAPNVPVLRGARGNVSAARGGPRRWEPRKKLTTIGVIPVERHRRPIRNGRPRGAPMLGAEEKAHDDRGDSRRATTATDSKRAPEAPYRSPEGGLGAGSRGKSS